MQFNTFPSPFGSNAILFVIVSRLSRRSSAEKEAAEACTVNDLRRPYRWELSVKNVNHYRYNINAIANKLSYDLS